MDYKERQWLWSWDAIGYEEESAISSISMIAMVEFGETGQYTFDEVQLLNKIVHDKLVPYPVWKEFKWLPDGTNASDSNRESAIEYEKQLMAKFKKLNERI